MYLAWEKTGDRWAARSVDGTEVRIYPYHGQQDLLVVEGDLGDKTYTSRNDATDLVAQSLSPARARERIITIFKQAAEGYVLRFEITGIQDPLAANDHLLQMAGRGEFYPKWTEWRERNRPYVAAPNEGAEGAPAPAEETRYVHLLFALDTNRINSKQQLHSMNRLEEWRRRGVIDIELPETVAVEAAAGNNPGRTKKVRSYVHTLNMVETSQERPSRQTIEQAIFPAGTRTPSERNDVEIVLNASRYGATLVTADGASARQPGGILGARRRLIELGIRVVTDEEACDMVRQRISARDERARYEAQTTGVPLPDWVGKDDLP
jgi:hypothetical protein